MTLTIELPDNLEAALRAQANAEGVSEAGYVRRMLERGLAASTAPASAPFETGHGNLAKNGAMPSQEEIDANHADMLDSAQAAVARILELRKGNLLPEGVSIRDLIHEGRA